MQVSSVSCSERVVPVCPILANRLPAMILCVTLNPCLDETLVVFPNDLTEQAILRGTAVREVVRVARETTWREPGSKLGRPGLGQ